MVTLKVISGGQTGADRAALDVAMELGLPTGGFCTKGRHAEDGRIPDRYPLVETESYEYPVRTRANVMAAHGCLWFGNPHSPGGKLTLGLCANVAFIPMFVVLGQIKPIDVTRWIVGHLLDGEEDAVTLLVAGNRESKSPGIYARTKAFLLDALNPIAAAQKLTPESLDKLIERLRSEDIVEGPR
jgi:hypothetical protein